MRVRATLTVMDSNIRIDSCRQDRRMRMKTHLATTLHSMCNGMSEALAVLSSYMASPFTITSSHGWRGSLDRQDSVRCNLRALRVEITAFTAAVLAELQETNTLRRQNSSMQINSESDSESEDIFADTPTHIRATTAIATEDGADETSSFLPLASEPFNVIVETSTLQGYSSPEHRHQSSGRRGEEREERRTEHLAYHKLSPMRAFCNMAVQCAVQLTSMLQETDVFMGTLLHIGIHTTAATTATATATASGSGSASVTAVRSLEAPARVHGGCESENQPREDSREESEGLLCTTTATATPEGGFNGAFTAKYGAC